jgi:hypothetical protein
VDCRAFQDVAGRERDPDRLLDLSRDEAGRDNFTRSLSQGRTGADGCHPSQPVDFEFLGVDRERAANLQPLRSHPFTRPQEFGINDGAVRPSHGGCDPHSRGGVRLGEAEVVVIGQRVLCRDPRSQRDRFDGQKEGLITVRRRCVSATPGRHKNRFTRFRQCQCATVQKWQHATRPTRHFSKQRMMMAKRHHEDHASEFPRKAGGGLLYSNSFGRLSSSRARRGSGMPARLAKQSSKVEQLIGR